jgi:hypothetical protein
MKLSEFLTEEQYFKSRQYGHDDLWHTMPNTVEMPDITAQNPYLIYRIGMSLADHTTPIEGGRFNEYGILAYYSEEEAELCNKLLKQSGIKVNEISSSRSEEPDNTNKVSPLPNPGPIKKK